MERDEDLLLSLIGFLLAHGYPKESLVIEWPIDKRYRADLAVIDPDTNKALALFELKRRKTNDSLKMALKQLETFSKALGDEQVPTYAVFGKDGDPPFEIFYLPKPGFEESEAELIGTNKVPDFSTFKISKITKTIAQTLEKRKATLNSFQILCWIAAFFASVLLLLDFLNILDITPERLALIGIIVGLIVIPFASKLKILGIEFERLTEKKKI